MFFLYWLVAVMPLEQHWLWGYELFGTFTVIKVLGAVCLLIAVFRMLSGAPVSSRFTNSQARWFMVFALFLCTSFLHRLEIPWIAASHVFAIVALFITVITLVDSRTKLYRIILLAIGAAGFVSLYAIRGMQKYGGSGGDIRPGGLLGDANEYALLAGLWIPLAFLWASGKRPLWERLLCWGCLISALLGTTFAASRGGFLGLVAALVYLIFRSRHSVRNFAILCALMAPLALVFSSSAMRRLANPNANDKAAEANRLVAWKAGLGMIRQHPLTGIGLHNFRFQVAMYEDPDEQVISLAHNTYLELTAELGIPGLIAYLGVLGAVFYALERVRKRTNAAGLIHLTNIALGFQAGLVSYAISSFFMSAWWQRMVWLLLFLSICLGRVSVLAMRSSSRSQEAFSGSHSSMQTA